MAFSLGAVGNQGAIPSYGDLLNMANVLNPEIASLAGAGTTDTLTAYQMVSGIFVRSGATAAVASTTDTAANIITALGANAFAGMSFMLIYVNVNTSSGAVTLTGGTGVTLSGTTTVPIAAARFYIGTVTSTATPAITLQGAFAIGSGVVA
jgi:hypothetical protein